SGNSYISSAVTHIGNNHKIWPNAPGSPYALLSSTAVPYGAWDHNTRITRGRTLCLAARITNTVVPTTLPAVPKTLLIALSAPTPTRMIPVPSAAPGPDAGTPGSLSADSVPARDFAPLPAQLPLAF
ncbi:hypothetical protein PENFLA_c102G09554, partial [Penicillium flavigenum]